MRTLILTLSLACTGSSKPAEPPAEPTPAPPEPAPAPSAPAAPAAPTNALTVETSAGAITIMPVYHATTVIQADGKTIWLDPWSKADLEGKPPADIVLVTDIHPDHLDKDAIAKVAKPEAVVVAPKAVADALKDRPVQHVLANGEAVTLGALTITAVPMYNLTRGPESGGVFHEKGRGNGYTLSMGGKTVYFAGDTECTDEMKALTGVDLAFVPMNLPYTMPPEEAAECVKAFKPAQVVPYHYAGSDRGVFVTAIDGAGPQALVLDYYPGGEPSWGE